MLGIGLPAEVLRNTQVRVSLCVPLVYTTHQHHNLNYAYSVIATEGFHLFDTLDIHHQVPAGMEFTLTHAGVPAVVCTFSYTLSIAELTRAQHRPHT